ncbi:unnamed protein product, partial [Nesidiocoris tenuis]
MSFKIVIRSASSPSLAVSFPRKFPVFLDHFPAEDRIITRFIREASPVEDRPVATSRKLS